MSANTLLPEAPSFQHRWQSPTKIGATTTAILFLYAALSSLTAAQVFFGRQVGGMAPISFFYLLLLHLAHWVPWLVLIPAIQRLGIRFPLDRASWLRSVPVHIIAAVLIGACKLLADNVFMCLVSGVSLSDPRFLPNYAMFLSTTLHTQLIIYGSILGICQGAIYVGRYRNAVLPAGSASNLPVLEVSLNASSQVSVNAASVPVRDPSRTADAVIHPADRLAAPYLDRLSIRTNGTVTLIPIATIDWIEAADYYVEIHAGPATHLLRQTMTKLEHQLAPDQFVRVHRSAIVNLAHIAKLERRKSGDYAVVLKDGTEVSLSRGRRKALEAVLISKH